MFAPIIFILLKSSPEKLNLAALRIVILLAAKIIYCSEQSNLLL